MNNDIMILTAGYGMVEIDIAVEMFVPVYLW